MATGYNEASIATVYSDELGAYKGWVLAIYMLEGQTINIQYESGDNEDQNLADVETDLIFLQKFLTLTQEE